YTALDVSGHIHYGDITDNLKEIIPHHKAWLVVVGNSSANDSGFWLGSNLLSTLRNLQCPVIAVPESYLYKKVGKIAFACDLKNLENNLPAEDLVRLVQKSGGQLHVLSVDHENRHFDPDTPYEYEVLEESLHAAHPEFHNIDNKDVEEGIRSFINNEEVDWLVVVPHKHSFFESLFHKSQTKAIVQHAHIPIVALHEKA
ncbi:MAG: universal stress protein, partial [Chitinophagaceae bacterium]|nr:universal stress protein [Chitinophagaceae bacterium]